MSEKNSDVNKEEQIDDSVEKKENVPQGGPDGTDTPGGATGGEINPQAAKNSRTGFLAAVTRKQNVILDLMDNPGNLLLVKTNTLEFEDQYSKYKDAHNKYIAMIEGDDLEKEEEAYRQKRMNIAEFIRGVNVWIRKNEDDLADSLDSAGGRRSHKSKQSKVSHRSMSSRAAEKAKVAELEVEREMLQKLQRAQAAQQALELDMKLAKARAREKAFSTLNYDAPEFVPNGQGSAGAVPKQREVLKSRDEEEMSSVRLERYGRDFPNVPDDPVDECDDGRSVSGNDILAVMSLPKPTLRVFHGDIDEYLPFIRAFEARVASKLRDPADKLYFLYEHLGKGPRDLIEGCMAMGHGKGYEDARKILEDEYGDSFKLSNVYISKLESWPSIKANDNVGLKDYALYLSKCQTVMKSVSYLKVLNHSPHMLCIVQKLPVYLQHKWRDLASKMRVEKRKIAEFDDLVKFVKSAAEASNDPIYGKVQSVQSEGNNRNKDTKSKKKHETQSHVTNVSPSISCPLCSQQHDLEDCSGFQAKNVEERRIFLRDKRLCFACFQYGHTSKGCSAKRRCTKCRKPHPTSLHIDGYCANGNNASQSSVSGVESQSNRNRSGRTTESSVCTATEISDAILHAILPVKISQGHRGKSVVTYAFYDNGSSGCFITNELQCQLQAVGIPTILQLRTMHGCSHSDSNVVKNLIVSDLNGENSVELPKSYTRDEIPVNRNHIPRPEDIVKIKHLRQITDMIPRYMPELGIGILIGSDCPLALEPLEVIPAKDGYPYAVRIRHGWTLHGPVKSAVNEIGVQAHRTVVRELETFKELMTPSCVLEMFEKVFVDDKSEQYPEQRGMSYEDRQFMKIAENGISFDDGHYTLPLPFRDKVNMPNNRSYALKRLMHQKSKMLKDPQYHNDYSAFMSKLIEKGHAEPTNQSYVPDGSIWYLPHHGVYHPNKPSKIRVVFDCSSSYGGVSLNSCLLQGPDLTNSLVGVLTRFREESVAFIGDIESMFYQVKVPPEQRSFLRFLWWPDGSFQTTPRDYQMTVHLFGAVSSPSIANFALRKTALFAPNPQITSTILTNFYVDDCLKSLESIPAAISHIDELRTTCMAGGFRLTKFVSNEVKVMQSIPGEEHSKEIQKCDLAGVESLIERALGVQWDIKSDQFGFSIKLKDRPFTRRGILSMMSSIFDPLGFLGPVILPAKKLLQDLCKEQYDWDETIPEEHMQTWREWLGTLHKLKDLKIERQVCGRSSGLANSNAVKELHVFADASSIGYGAVVYQRTFDSKDPVNVVISFMIGKSRLAPIKMVTIPKLELNAAVTGIKLATMMKYELDGVDSITYYTDSTTVLHYIQNDKKRWPVFVANRVQLIRNFSDPAEWHYVSSDLNPADDASRGISVEELLNESVWLKGPDFLHDQNKQDFASNESELEVHEVAVQVSQAKTDAVHYLIHYFSSWQRLKMAVAVFSKVKCILRDRVRAKQDPSITRDHASYTIKVSDIEQAETQILQWLHLAYFQKEINDLSNDLNNSVAKSSPLRSLDPFIENGILRVGGRLRHANLDNAIKHPVILPRKSHITSLVIDHMHKRLGHAGRNHVLSELRQTYWIISANSAVRNAIYQCVTCRKLRGPSGEQKMADLPTCRVDDTAPPFTSTGVDYFGPFIIHERRKNVKQYGVLFTCLASRAIHIEIAESLDTDSFLNALRRFVARRGNIRQLYSDNGTNFVGAEKELKASLKEMNQGHIESQLRNIGIDWKFNPPLASNMGGAWERLIRTVRKVLSGLLQEHSNRLDRESFSTLICEVEAIVNSRPLTCSSGDGCDLEPLTPNHILTGRTQVTTPPPGIFDRDDLYVRRRWRRVQYLSNLFWSRWKNEFLLLQQRRQKWNQPRRNMHVGDIVIMRDDNTPRNEWPLGIVKAVEPDSTGYIRVVTVKTQHSEYKRPINKLVLLVPNDDDN